MGSVALDRDGFILNGERRILLVGSLFYFRVPRASWRDRMEKLKLAGYRALDVYFPWNHHELAPGVWDFAGERDICAFLALAREVGLYVMARPGPYICSEWDGGGLPAWLSAAQMRLRDNDPAYLHQVSKWFDRVLPILREHSFTKGGCVIAVQLENELDFYSGTLDRPGYIAKLRAMAQSRGIDVPLLCCSGQSGLAASGALAEGVFPAMNFYPDPRDRLFGERVRFFESWLSGRGLPLLVTETNRGHRFLRFLLLLGAKLLGPYNQAGGTDFGYTTAVNNWGKPLSFQTSDYMFDSMISPSGEIDQKALLEARVLCGLMDALPGLAVARPATLPAGCRLPEEAFAAALSLPEGGLAAGIMHYGKTPAQLVWPENGHAVTLPPLACTLVLSHVSLHSAGFPGKIVFSDAVPVLKEDGRLVFAAEHENSLVTLQGFEAPVLPWEQAAFCPFEIETGEPFDMPLSWKNVSAAELLMRLPAAPVQNGALALEQNGIFRGVGIYEAAAPVGTYSGFLLTDAADLITVSLGEKCLGTYSPGGHPVFIPAKCQQTGAPLTVRAEIWGHCNFDDPQCPSLSISSLRGVKSIVAVTSTTPLPLWVGPGETSGDAPRLSALGEWLTGRTPMSGVWQTECAATGSVRFLHFDGLNATAEVFVNGRQVGRADRLRPWLDIGAIPPKEDLLRIACRVEKPDYTAFCSVPMLYQGELLPSVTLRAMGEAELCGALQSLREGAAPLSLPIFLENGQNTAIYGIIRKGDCEISIDGTDVLATVLRGDRICGRILLHGGGFPMMAGGRPDTAYLPACFGGELQILVQALSAKAALRAIRLRTVGTVMPGTESPF